MIRIEDLFDGNLIRIDRVWYEVQIQKGTEETNWLPVINLIGKPTAENIKIEFTVVK